MSLADVSLAVRKLAESEGTTLTKLPMIAGDPALSSEGAASLQRLSMDVEGLTERHAPWDFLLTWLTDRTRYLVALADDSSVGGRLRAVAVWQFLNFARVRGPATVWPPIRRLLDRVRQLVLLAEERDLRQVPAGALHMEAVRLMTVHASKGLEFEAVHVPGLTTASFPTNWRGARCPPPDGLIDSEDKITGIEEMKLAHVREEECLFFVAASRAQMHLRLTLCRKQSDGKNRKPSEFLTTIARVSMEVRDPPRLTLPPEAPSPRPIEIAWPTDWRMTEARLKSYSGCPRRFFYTHALGLRGARKPTAFTRTHACLYAFIDWMAAARLTETVEPEAARAHFEEIWRERGPVEHAFAADYRQLADRMIAALIRLSADRKFRADVLALDLPNGRVLVKPDEMAQLPDGTVVLRRIRTGHRRQKEYDELEYTLYALAARAHFGSNYVFEAVHLADELIEPVTITDEKLFNRRQTSDALLGRVSAGWFPPKVDAVTCPRCPHFFVCDALPHGKLVPATT